MYYDVLPCLNVSDHAERCRAMPDHVVPCLASAGALKRVGGLGVEREVGESEERRVACDGGLLPGGAGRVESRSIVESWGRVSTSGRERLPTCSIV